MKTLSNHLYQSLVAPGYEVFTIIKPGFLGRSQDIIEYFKGHGWTVRQMRTTQLTLKQAKELYKVHKGEDFYEDLCTYMSSGSSCAIIYKHPGQLMMDGFEVVARLKDEIRKKWGIDDCKNVLHSSDSQDAMDHESQIYF